MKLKSLSLMILLGLVFALTACAALTPTADVQAPALTQTPFSSPVQPTFTLQAPSGTPVLPTATSAPTFTPLPPSPTGNPVHTIGQAIKLQNLTLALIGVAYTPDQIQVTFAAKNDGPDSILPPYSLFSAASADGSNLKPDPCFIPAADGQKDYNIPYFAGSLQHGENLRGTICWKSADPALQLTPQTGNRVFFIPEPGAKPADTWDVSAAGTADVPPELVLSDFATPPHAQGEAVALKDIAVTFNGVTYSTVAQKKNGTAQAHFTLENKGSASYKFGQYLINSFVLKLTDGLILTGDTQTAGCQDPLLNIEIPANQKRPLTLCFHNPGSSALPSGSLAIFYPHPDEGDRVFWMTK